MPVFPQRSEIRAVADGALVGAYQAGIAAAQKGACAG